MATRKELIDAVRERYGDAPSVDKTKILDEFVELTGYHRKHAIRLLTHRTAASPAKTARRRVYGDKFRQALIVLWKAGDRVCGKRLKALIPLLIEAVESHGQPSFKLKSKTRDGARLSKKYHLPLTPCARLLASISVADEVKANLRRQLGELDPVQLLRDMHTAQQVLGEMSSRRPGQERVEVPTPCDVSTFLAGLATAWKDGEVRPTHRRKASVTRHWRSRVDPFEHA